MGGIIQSVKGMNRTERWKKSEFALFSGTGTPIFSFLILRPLTQTRVHIIGLLVIRSLTWTYITDLLGSQAFGFRLNFTAGFPGSSAWVHSRTAVPRLWVTVEENDYEGG